MAAWLAGKQKWEEALPHYQHLIERQPFRREPWIALRSAYSALQRRVDAENVNREIRRRFGSEMPSGPQFGGILELVGHQIESKTVRQGDAVQYALVWKVLRDPKEEFSVFAHLTKDGRRVAGHDHFPLHGVLPTSSWTRGDFILEGAGSRSLLNWLPIPISSGLVFWIPQGRSSEPGANGFCPGRSQSHSGRSP